MYKIIIFLAVAAFGSSEGLKWVNGTCPNWQDLPRYIPEGGLFYKYLYQQRSQNNFLFEEEGRCVKSYNSAEHGILLSTYEQINENNKTEMGIATAEVEGDKDFPTTHIFKLKFMRSDRAEIDMPTILVATDQENYGVLYSCKSMLDRSLDIDTNPRKLETVLAFTTKRGDTSFDDKIKSELAAIGLRQIITYHLESCTYSLFDVSNATKETA
ncbi:hypothetical protein GE061_015445 [Apolygus lucorum]|uniref:Lipocalin/cytosolic fatty-acid binding domain-containing protein n=1 Tax=Apolygus lucorum TaxID=248454 RepID=A0A8S9XNT3_APOLU|nr:hypothetical protein GE061_015445 [Apolygus lucorum]